MGEYRTIDRTQVIPHECKWDGQVKQRMYAYNGLGPFCNRKCWESYTDDKSKLPISTPQETLRTAKFHNKRTSI